MSPEPLGGIPALLSISGLTLDLIACDVDTCVRGFAFITNPAINFTTIVVILGRSANITSRIGVRPFLQFPRPA